VILFFGGAELLSRIKYTPKKISSNGIFEYDREKGYRHKKNYIGKETNSLGGSNDRYTIITNSQGYRDSEIPALKPAKTIRILVIGDSISYGYGVAGHHVYAEYLEDILNRRKNEYHFDVINTAASGNSSFHEYYDLKRGLKFSPDLIIQQFTLNDVIEPFLASKRLGGHGHLKDYHGVDDVPYYDHLLQQYSAFYLFFKDMALRTTHLAWTKKDLKEKAQRRELYTARNLIKQHNHPIIKEAWVEYFRWMGKINSIAIAKDSSLPMILLATPFAFQFPMDHSMAYPQEELRKYSKQNHIIYMDFLAFLQNEFRDRIIQKYELSKNSSYSDVIAFVTTPQRDEIVSFWTKYFLDYDHFTPRGHKLAAEFIYPRIISALGLEETGAPILPGD